MEKGLAIIEMTDTETKGFYIDQDALEFSRLNAQTSKHLREAEKNKKVEQRNYRRYMQAKAQRKAYNIKTFTHVLISLAVVGAVAWAGMAGMIHPIICIPVGLFCLCAACLRLGAWFGRNHK